MSEDLFDQLYNELQLLKQAWNGRPLSDAAEIRAAIDNRIEYLKFDNRSMDVRTGASTTSSVQSTSDPRQYPATLRSAIGCLVTITFHQKGDEMSGIVEQVNTAEKTVTLSKVLEDFLSVFPFECYYPRGVIDFHDASLICVHHNEHKKEEHLTEYDKSPLAEVGRLASFFIWNFDSYKGVVEQVDWVVKKVSLTYVITDTGKIFERMEFDMDNIFDGRYLTDGYEMHSDDELIEHMLQIQAFVEETRHMSAEQSEAFSEFKELWSDCRLHGSTVYGLATPASDIDVCVENVGDVCGFPGYPFEVVSDQVDERISRVILRHPNGTHVDVVGMQLFEPEKDKVLTRICKIPCFKEYLTLIRGFVKTIVEAGMVPMHGYPNTFNMLLVGIFFLQSLEILPVWCKLADTTQPDLQPCQEDSESLFGRFLCFLHNDAGKYKMDLHVGTLIMKRERLFDPRRPRRQLGIASWLWNLEDPCNGKLVFAGCDQDNVANVKEIVLATLERTSWELFIDRWLPEH